MTEIIISIIGFITTLVGGGILFYKQNKRLKLAEAMLAERNVSAKDLENERTSNQEWIKLYNEQCAYSKRLEAKLQLVNDDNKQLRKIEHDYAELDAKQRIIISQLTWSRCDVNECPNRKPPRDYEHISMDIDKLHAELNKDRDELDGLRMGLYNGDEEVKVEE